MEMEIVASQQQGRVEVTVLRVNGRVNTGTAPELQARAEKAIEDGSRYLLLDMRETQSMTSVGLRAIHAIYKRLLGNASDEGAEAANKEPVKSTHLKLLLSSADSSQDKVNPIRKVFVTSGFDAFLEIHDSLTDAVDSF